jgi:hypothetical protein
LLEFREMGISGDEEVLGCGARESNEVIIAGSGVSPE